MPVPRDIMMFERIISFLKNKSGQFESQFVICLCLNWLHCSCIIIFRLKETSVLFLVVLTAFCYFFLGWLWQHYLKCKSSNSHVSWISAIAFFRSPSHRVNTWRVFLPAGTSCTTASRPSWITASKWPQFWQTPSAGAARTSPSPTPTSKRRPSSSALCSVSGGGRIRGFIQTLRQLNVAWTGWVGGDNRGTTAGSGRLKQDRVDALYH